MSKDTILTKYCNCLISSNKEILKSNTHSSFCEKCGSILMKDSHETINYTLKQKINIVPCEYSPINIIKSMKKKTEKYFPYIYNAYNNPQVSDIRKKDELMKPINIYLKFRKKLLLNLQRLIKKFDYCDSSFYQCLFFLDTYLSHDITVEMSEKAVFYYLVGYFLCAIKLKETDITEPTFDSFIDLEKGIFLSPNKVALHEVLCLQKIKYNIFSYSPYEWMKQFISNGVIFDSEVDKTNEIILIKGHRHLLVNTVGKYSIKLLLAVTSKDIFFKYSPMYLALSLIQLTREQYINDEMIKPKLFQKLLEIYGVDYSSYQKCYEEIKYAIKDDNSKLNAKENKNEVEDKPEKKGIINLKRFSVDKAIKNFDNNNRYNDINNTNMNIKSSKNLTIIKNNSIVVNKAHKNEHLPNISRNSRNRRKTHLSIDCTNNTLGNPDSLPMLTINNQKEMKEYNQKVIKLKKFLKAEEEEEEQKAIEKELNNTNNNFRKNGKRYLTSKKLNKITIERLVNDRNNEKNKVEPNKGNDNITNFELIKNVYKYKTSKHLDLNIAFPEVKYL